MIVGFSLGGHLASALGGRAGAAARRQVMASWRSARRSISTSARGGSTPRPRSSTGATSSPASTSSSTRWSDARRPAVRRASCGSSGRAVAATTIRAWDGLVVAPRWGFASAEDYYARASAAAVLPAIDLPGWIVHSAADPMVPPWTVAPGLARLPAAIAVTRTARGGHVGMPADLDLGQPGARGLYGQIVGWVARTLGG
ncbi:MAG: hypothetical protein R2862_11620 [Thermoanaerobaculia bacterium]